MDVKVLEVCKVTPPPGSPNDMYVPLTFFDLIWLRFTPVEYLFFYEIEESFSIFPLLRKLKHSLSLTLEFFLPLAGNLVWPQNSPNPFIYYKEGDGVVFTVAESDSDFHRICSEKIREARIFSPLIAELTVSDTQVPLLAVKITFFRNAGFCIGITMHHVSSDAKSFIMFLKSWASFSKLDELKILVPEVKKPIFRRKLVRERYVDLEKLYIAELMKQNGANPRSLAFDELKSLPDNKVRGTFQLSGLDAKRLKEFVLTRLGSNYKHEELKRNLHVSKFSVIHAYLILCFAKAKESTETKVGFWITVDSRARLEPPLSENYFGNCLCFSDGYVEREKLTRNDGILAALSAISRAIKSFEKGVSKKAETYLEPDEEPKIAIAGHTEYDTYCLDFGWGRPRKVDITSIDKTEAISIMKGRHDGGGVEIELTLKRHEMDKFAFAFGQGLNEMKHTKASL